MTNFKEVLSEKLLSRVVFISYINNDNSNNITKKPYTRHPDMYKSKLVDCGEDEIDMFDILLDKSVCIKLNRILSYNIHYVDNEETHLKHADYVLDIIRGDLNQADTDNISNEDIQDIYFSKGCDLFHLCRIFDFKISVESIESNSLDEEELTFARERWLSIIRRYRDKQLIELDEVAKQVTESGDEDEIEDIEMIKQMFRDIPQDVDMSEYNELKEIISFWPPLLLPLPEDL